MDLVELRIRSYELAISFMEGREVPWPDMLALANEIYSQLLGAQNGQTQ